jgi:hypothetical protein
MKKHLSFIAITFLFLAATSCSKKDDPAPISTTDTFVATINGSSEVPANSSPATGSATAVFNKTTKVLTITTTFTGLTATNAHIHKGAVGVSGGVIFPFASPFTSPIVTVTPALTADQETDLYAHLYYVNLHTAALPGGEIRGQLIKQ